MRRTADEDTDCTAAIQLARVLATRTEALDGARSMMPMIGLVGPPGLRGRAPGYLGSLNPTTRGRAPRRSLGLETAGWAPVISKW
jgi:hypothetical protein